MNQKHVQATPITSKQNLRDRLFNYRTTDTLEDIFKQFRDTHLTGTETSHDTETSTRRASTQCNNGTVTNSDNMLSPNTTKSQEIDTAVDSKINGKLADPAKKGRQQSRHMVYKHCETNACM